MDKTTSRFDTYHCDKKKKNEHGINNHMDATLIDETYITNQRLRLQFGNNMHRTVKELCN